MKLRFGLLLASVCIFSFAGFAQAADKSNTGCGLGSIMFKEKDGLLSNVCAVTFNGFFGNQTFGITSGTLECSKPASFVSNEKLNKFVRENMDNLAVDISKGNGEYLMTLAVLMDTPAEERDGLYAKLQANFSNIYTSDQVTHEDVLGNIERLVVAG
ncbi:MAG: DUF3015 family protein [Candidatus Eisenbacteria bacterium]|uniref:DUF3015 family protein n=1 Tax=Eiseniibacteriota bacterium TaxID=2212470 RepID=A0A956NAP3_UNCEI|nr:DUF3015 family protein [Candidatus Eisenbacteria bacterium]MCB9464752.1 DUF3015 family protein [Candidatus Eisenbacteria bacterium]